MRSRALSVLSLPFAAFLLLLTAATPWPRNTLAGTRPASPASAANAPHATWPEVAPILYANCTTCHHPHGNSPFSLLTYTDARRWGTQVAAVTASHYMPPWLPAHGYGDFADERTLSEKEIALLAAWVKAGMPEGDVANSPPAPVYNDVWVGGKPDLVLTVAEPFALPASGEDLFHNFILPFPLQGTHYVRAIEIRPSAPEVVHHANLLLDRTASLRRAHAANWKAGVDGMELNIDSGNTFDPDGHFLFWKADSPLLSEPAGMPWELDGGNDLVLNMHLKPSGKALLVSAQIGLYFTPDPPAKQPMLLQLEHDRALDIPPGDAHFTVEDHLTLPADVSVLGIYPHTHYLGKDLQAWAVLPDGKKRWLIWIRDWDIDRQAVYRFREPVFLPKGTTIAMHYTYDNSAANPHNPHLPPVRVKAGDRSEDEMGHLWLQVLPVRAQDDGTDPRLVLEEAWMRRRLEKEPGDALARYNLASALEGQGRFREAAQIYKQQLASSSNDPRFLNGLGGALESAGDAQGAQAAYQQAIATTPDDCDARFNLARLDLRHNQADAAVMQFRALLSRCPPDAAVHSGLASALSAQGDLAGAQAEYAQALALDPNDFTANYAQGAAHLAAGNTGAAIPALQRAVSANSHDLDAREHLAFAFAQAGRMDDAAAQLKAAIQIAPTDASLHALLSQLLGAKGDLAGAIAEQKQSLKLHPGDADQWNNLGVLEARNGDRTAAAADFRQALTLKHNDPQAQANLELLQRATRQ